MRIKSIVALADQYVSLANTLALRSSADINGGGSRVVRAYHGSSHPVRRFDRSKTVDGTFWFSEDFDKILRGESGAASVKWLIEVDLLVDQVAGWEEYDRYYLEQLESMGYSAIHLDNDWIIFDPDRIKIISVGRV